MKWYFKRWKRTCTASFCVLVLMLSSVSVFAGEDISSLEQKTTELQNQLEELNSKMLSISDEISSTEMQIEIADSEILRMQDDLTRAQAEEAQHYEDMKIRIKFMYETGNISLLEMLLSAENMADFLNKAEFIQNVSSYDRTMLQELGLIREGIASEKESLEQQQADLITLKAQLENQKQELADEAEKTSTDLSAFQEKLAILREEEARRLEEEARKRAEAAQAAVSDGTQETFQQSAPSAPVSSDDLTLFACILECEAHQQYDCLLAVATVIMNRVESPRFANTVREIIYSPGQFAPVTNGSLNRIMRKGPTALSLQVARDALNGSRLASVADCYYFLWAGSTNRRGVNIGDNLFFARW